MLQLLIVFARGLQQRGQSSFQVSKHAGWLRACAADADMRQPRGLQYCRYCVRAEALLAEGERGRMVSSGAAPQVTKKSSSSWPTVLLTLKGLSTERGSCFAQGEDDTALLH